MELLISGFLFLALAIQTAPVALGLNKQKPGFLRLVFRLIILALSQAIMLQLGFWLGNRFMYLLRDWSNMVLFAGFFIIAVRIIIDTFKIRKGERTYTVNKDADIIVPSLAVAINTFLAGILLYYVPVDKSESPFIIFVYALIVGFFFAYRDFNRRSFAMVSLFNLLAGVILIVISLFFAFF